MVAREAQLGRRGSSMAKKLVAAVVVLLALGVCSPFLVPAAFAVQLELVIVVLCGVAVVAMLRALAQVTRTASAVAVPADAVVLREGPANYKDGWLMVGGVLKLTPDHLVFSAHGFAQKARVHTWELRGVQGASPARTLGLVPNAMLVRFATTEIKLVVHDRDTWMRAIRSAAAGPARAS
jgi:hypothetical protein